MSQALPSLLWPPRESGMREGLPMLSRAHRGAGTEVPLGWTTEGACGHLPSPCTPCAPQAAKHTEPCYANLELQMRSLGAQPMQPMQPEVEYSIVVSTGVQAPAWGPWTMPEASPWGWRWAGREVRGWLGKLVPLRDGATQQMWQVRLCQSSVSLQLGVGWKMKGLLGWSVIVNSQ